MLCMVLSFKQIFRLSKKKKRIKHKTVDNTHKNVYTRKIWISFLLIFELHYSFFFSMRVLSWFFKS